MQFYPESCYISCKTKAAGLPPYRLMFIFCQRRRHGCRRAFSLPEFVRRIAPPVWIDSHHAILPEKLLHPRKTKAAGLPPIPLDVYFFPTQTAGCRRTFSLPESVRRITPPVQTILTSQTYPESYYIQCKTKAVGLPPYRLMFIFCQRRRHGCHRAFSLPESVRRIAPPMRTHGR